MELISNRKNYMLGKNVFGFSGSGNDQILTPNALIFDNDDLRIYIFHKNALTTFHKPQDSLGFMPKIDELVFAIADGVSIVNGTNSNDSGILSHDLVANLCEEKNGNFEGLLLSVSKKLPTMKPCASTFVGGVIKTSNRKKQLLMTFITKPQDTGMNYLVTDNLISEIPNYSFGFVPGSHNVYEYRRVLPDSFSIVISSDGVYFNDQQLMDVLSLIKNKEDIGSISRKIELMLKDIKDDKSLMIIQSHDF